MAPHAQVHRTGTGSGQTASTRQPEELTGACQHLRDPCRRVVTASCSRCSSSAPRWPSWSASRSPTPSESDDSTQSDIVERFIPRPNDEVLRQAELGIDLAPGYDGTLAVNGVDIPAEDQRRVPEQNEVFFTPGEGKAVEQLLAGPELRHRDRVEGGRRPGHGQRPHLHVVLRGDVSRLALAGELVEGRAAEQATERGLVEHRHALLVGLVELRPGLGAGDRARSSWPTRCRSPWRPAPRAAP